MPYVGNEPTSNFVSVTKDLFSGDGSTVAFTISKASTTNGVAVFVENVRQEPTIAYAVSGTTLTFTAAPITSSGNNIYVLHHNAPASTANHPAAQALTATSGTFTSSVNFVKDYESITAATKTLTAADSGTTFGFNRAAGIVVTLPTPAAGIHYHFLVETTFTGVGQIKTATTDGTDGFLGTAFLFDTGQIGETDNFHPAASNDIIDLGAVEQGWLTGGWIKLTGTNTTTWWVEAFLMGDGTLATPFVDS